MGLQLLINGELYDASVNHGVLTLIISQKVTDDVNEINIDFSALEILSDGTRENKGIFSDALKYGDEITIKIK